MSHGEDVSRPTSEPDAPSRRRVHRSGLQHGLIPDVLRSVTRSVSRRPSGVLWLVTLLVLLSLGISARFLSFKTDRSDLIDANAEFQQRWLEYTSRFGQNSDAVVVVESQDTNAIKRVLDDLGRQLEAQPQLFDRVFYKFDPTTLKGKGLQYLPSEELEYCLNSLNQYGDILDGRWDRAGLQTTTETLNRRLKDQDPAERTVALTQAHTLTYSLRDFVVSGEFTSPWPTCFSESARFDASSFQPIYQITESGHMGFLLTVLVDGGDDFQGSSQSIDRLRELIGDTEELYPGVEIGLTGIPILESDEMRRSQSDMTIASVISFVGVGLLLLLGFRGVRHPALAMLMLLVGLSWSVGYATLVVGHLNILSVSFTAILVGLGIDFAIHYLARYLELRHAGVELRPALLRTSWGVGTGIVTAAVTTALAFFCATFTTFLGVAELGIIAGGGILLCCVTTFVVLPALIAIADRRVEPRRLPSQFQGVLLRRLTARRPMIVTIATIAAIIVISTGSLTLVDGHVVPKVKYDSNLLNLQARGVDSVNLQNRVFRESQGSLLYAVSLAKSPQELLQRKAAFEQLSSVGRVEELASQFPRDQSGVTVQLVSDINKKLSHLSEFPREFPRLNPQAIGLALEDLFLSLRNINSPQGVEAVTALDELLNKLETFPLQKQVGLLDNYQYAMLAALKGQFEAIATVADPTPVSPGDFPEAVRERFVSRDGTWLLRVYPESQVWDEEPLARFVDDVRTVDPDVTGTPLQNFEAAGQIRDSYLQSAIYALMVIWIVLLVDAVDSVALVIGMVTPLAVIGATFAVFPEPQKLLNPVEVLALYLALTTAATAIFDFTNVRNTFLTMLPPLAGSALMFGILGFCGIDLNPANLIVLPLILGIGVDDGVHVMHDFRMQSGVYRTSASTINAIMLTSLTSMIGFGSMLVAAHRGLASLGLVLVIGVGSCLFVSLVTLPAILTLLSRRRVDQASHSTVATPHEVSHPMVTHS
ncbi:MAG: MMPL family transporter [Planctomycetaceae bacterium]|nr:MMPL family transporter [Planctomycetaceae bacterium]